VPVGSSASFASGAASAARSANEIASNDPLI
jgi:hypothetical protein